MCFPLLRFPVELGVEIIRLAAVPCVLPDTNSPAAIYKSALSLCLVSHRVRDVTMPFLLHTVIFTSQDALDLFIRTLDLQRYFASINSHLHINYFKYVRRIWSTRCWPPLVDHANDYYNDYSVLYPLFSRAQTIGFNSNSMHLFDEIIGGNRASTLPAWTCTRIVLAGSIRWNPIIRSAPGTIFLSQLTHLTLWSFEVKSCRSGSRIPEEIYRVPLAQMQNIVYFAFSITTTSSTSLPLLIYKTTPAESKSSLGGQLFREWILSDRPVDHGFIHELLIEPSLLGDVIWERMFAHVQDEISTCVKR